ncbi:MAG: transglycosylase SLT domain-containing protein [Chitinivibrionales bacterium]|nr:transglycosylase SLT domain-containing protein [Chitinivibrionales bacterium]
MAKQLTQIASFLIIIALSAVTHADEIFPTPDILKENVVFWKKIYTKVPTTKGLIHDREYPAVVYKKITVGKRSGRSRRNFLRKHISTIKVHLNIISSKPQAEWSAETRRIAKLVDKHIPQNDRGGAVHRIRFQQGQSDRFKRGLERSGAYLDTIRAILKQYNVPDRLAYLPHVESSFNTHAYSHVGAAGLWQFMRSTGRSYMTINYLVDERRDPFKSSLAAAKFLSSIYAGLKSWPLAITGYNHGPAGMRRAVRSTGSRDIAVIIQKHRSRSFRFASKNFYSCFLAASEIAANPEEYFSSIRYEKKLQVTDIILTHYIRPKVLSQYLGISQETLKKLNPALRNVVFSQQKQIPAGYALHLPVAISGRQALKSLAAIPDSLKRTEPDRPKYYKVRRGDNLYAIARRLGTTARAIALENGINRMNRIYAGQVLRIPGASIPASKPVKPVVEVAGAKPAKAKRPKPPAPQPVEKKTEPAAQTVEADTASAPDTLKEIFAAPALTDADNQQQKTVPATWHGSHFDVEVYNLEVVLSAAGDLAEIRVSINETIGHYADWLGIRTQSIRNLNRMGRSSTIRINQKLTIPADKDALDIFVAARLEYHMAIEEDFYTQYKVVDVKEYRVRRGQTLLDVCNAGETEIPLWLLAKHNKNTNLEYIYAGMTLWRPLIEQKTEEDIALESIEPGGKYPAYHHPSRIIEYPIMLLP